MARACGIDLAVSRRRCTGYAVIDEDENRLVVRKLKCLHTLGEILNEVADDLPDIVAVDAPLSGGGRVREVERALWRSGFKVLPPSMPGMRDLAKAGERLAAELRGRGFRVVETHPASAIKSSGLKGFEDLVKAFRVIIEGEDLVKLRSCKDLRDALVSALVARCVLRGCAEGIVGGVDVVFVLKRFGGGGDRRLNT